MNKVQPIYSCPTCNTAQVGKPTNTACAECKTPLEEIGWAETTGGTTLEG